MDLTPSADSVAQDVTDIGKLAELAAAIDTLRRSANTMPTEPDPATQVSVAIMMPVAIARLIPTSPAAAIWVASQVVDAMPAELEVAELSPTALPDATTTLTTLAAHEMARARLAVGEILDRVVEDVRWRLGGDEDAVAAQ